jgi:hypothetical protein
MFFLVVFVGALSALNLLLAFGLIRRLREHAALIDAVYEYVAEKPGGAVGDFRVTTVDGEPLGRDDLVPSTVVAFLAVDCKSCHEQLPHLLAWARGQDRERLVAVVDGRGGDPADLVTRLLPVARVVVDGQRAPVAGAFGVRSYPQFCVLGPDATVSAVAATMSRLPVGAAA